MLLNFKNAIIFCRWDKYPIECLYVFLNFTHKQWYSLELTQIIILFFLLLSIFSKLSTETPVFFENIRSKDFCFLSFVFLSLSTFTEIGHSATISRIIS